VMVRRRRRVVGGISVVAVVANDVAAVPLHCEWVS
jgi:hypothetical protein